jgi:hypothetical protein
LQALRQVFRNVNAEAQMVSRLSMTDDFRLDLMASVALIDLAVPVVSQALGLAEDVAYSRLAKGPGTLATGLRLGRARRLANMLRLLGLAVDITPGSAADFGGNTAFDLAMQVTETGQRHAIARRLAARLAMSPADVVDHLSRPGGLLRPGLTWAEVNDWRRWARGIGGLHILVSDPLTARFDLLPWDRPANPVHLAPLLRFLRRLGLGTCPLTGAVAACVNHATAALVLRRYPDCGLVALNRDFQRFDLVLVGAALPVQQELADFLATRTALPPHAFARPDRLEGLRIEGALSRADALAFQADYAAIGLETRLRLVLEREDGAT